ncbi:sensor histidine kinase [Nocardia farcinica]|uniref:sensor histidine kinase n=1 Tax=Nocardia farcinica TaxID=37329 RepID=UPI003208A913
MRRCPRRCWPSATRAAKPPGNCGPPWKRCATTANAPRTVSPTCPGLDVTLTVRGEVGSVPAAVERTAYRVVQEALTNITRHAAARSAAVSIEHRPGCLVVRVEDDGCATPAAAPVPGVGLLGMRERVTALGGRLRAAPRDRGGFCVHAELPVVGAR